jgi:Zn-dependent M28 family amino/carboxypeptidase
MRFAPLFCTLIASAFIALASAQDDAKGRLQMDVAALASPKMAGRGNNNYQDGLDKSIEYVVNSYKKIGLVPEIQRFPYRFINSSNDGPDGYLKNVIVSIKGHDATLNSQHIVVGAHLDHLGITWNQSGTKNIFSGADDNASGSAALMELVRHFQKKPPARSLIFIHFTGEEWGMWGSKHWVSHPTVDIDSVRLMVNLDMIGRLQRSKKLTFTAMGLGQVEIAQAIAMAPDGINVQADRGTSIFALASDHAPFVAKKIPAIFLFTGLHADYHRKTDIPDKINWEGLATVTQYAQTLITHYATSKDAPVFVPQGRNDLILDP